MNTKVSRRNFLKGSAVAAGLLSTGLLGMTASAESATDDIAWDGEYDVVVLGMGFAGCAAAIQAADNGAKVLIAEKAPQGAHGANSKVSGQYIMSTDDKDAMYTYLHALVSPFPNYDDEVLRTMVDGAYNNFDWLVNTLGADPKKIMQDEEWKASSFTSPVKVTAFDNREGYIMKWCEYPELEGGDHMLSILVNGTSFDASYFNLMNENVAARSSIDVWYEAPGKHLIQDKDGKIIGVKVAKEGKLLNIRAIGGVVLATGGYENNKTMLANYLQKNNIFCRGAVYNDGDGVTMAQEVGADLWHMSNAAGYNFAYQPENRKTCTTVSSTITKGVLVGSNGRRFMCEGTKSRHGRINIGGTWMMCPVPNPTWLVVDDEVTASTKLVSSFSDGNVDEIANGSVVSGNTLEELAANLGITDVDTFVKTIARYNEVLEAGGMDDLGRDASTMTPIKTAPFHAVKLVASMYNTQGGPRRNKYAQVLRPNGNPIPGLFSAGELGALWPDMYNGGGNISEATVFGRIAGENAAKNARGEFEGAEIVDIDAKEAADLAAEYAAAHAEAESTTAATNYKDGVYVGTANGYGGTLTVTVTIEGGAIKDIAYSGNETEAIGGTAIPTLIDEAIAGKTEWTDAVSGASLTTAAFEEALQAALAQAQ